MKSNINDPQKRLDALEARIRDLATWYFTYTKLDGVALAILDLLEKEATDEE